MFETYIEEKSLRTTARILNEKGYRTKARTEKGKPSGSVLFKNTNIQWMVKNPVYVGKIATNGQVYDGLHEAIISEEIFRQANEILAGNKRERGTSKNTKSIGLLNGLFRCGDCGVAMCHTYSKKGTFKYLYYVCLNAIKRGHRDCPTKSVSADKIEAVILEILRKLSQESRFKEKTWTGLTLEEQVAVIRDLLKEANYSAPKATLRLMFQNEKEWREFKVELKYLKNLPHFCKKEKIKEEPKIRQNLALAHQIQELLDTGKINDVKQLTGHLNMSQARIHQLMAMTLLSPAIQEEILLGESKHLSEIPEYKLREVTNESDWQVQGELWTKLLGQPAAN